jgi:dihydrodipicolinate synthase/N-acetylneuraminate lyase
MSSVRVRIGWRLSDVSAKEVVAHSSHHILGSIVCVGEWGQSEILSVQERKKSATVFVEEPANEGSECRYAW